MEIFRHFFTQKKGRIHRPSLQKTDISHFPFIQMPSKLMAQINLSTKDS